MVFDPVINDPIEIDHENPSTMRSVIIKSDGENLVGTVFLAAGIDKKPTVLLLHGFPGNDTNMDVAYAIQRAGWNVVTFHYRGCWGSKGKYSWNNCLRDVTNVYDAIKQEQLCDELKIDKDKIVLIGHSMGAFFATMAAIENKIDNVLGLALFNTGLAGELISDNEELRKFAIDSVNKGMHFVNIGKPEDLVEEMISNSSKWNLLSYVQELSKKNFYMISAEYDQTAPDELHYKPLFNIFNKVSPGKKYTELIKSGHGFTNKRIELARRVINWLQAIEFEK